MAAGQNEVQQPSASASFVTTPLIGVAISLPIIATVATALRFYAKRLRGAGRPQADDWTVLVTLVFCWTHSINTIVAGAIGGVNTIIVPPKDYVNIALRALFISSFLLITSLYMVKISILLFYYKLFSVNRRFRIVVVALSILLSAWWLVNIVLDFLATDPVDAAWKDAARAHHRFNFNNWYLAYSGFSILFDIIILCLPLPVISTLRINTRQKLSVLAIFWLGGFVCISAVVRFIFFYRSAYRLTGVGYNNYAVIADSFIWAEVEPNTSIIAACLPTYGPLFREGGLFPRWLGSVAPRCSMTDGHSSMGNANASGYIEMDEALSDRGYLFRVTEFQMQLGRDELTGKSECGSDD